MKMREQEQFMHQRKMDKIMNGEKTIKEAK